MSERSGLFWASAAALSAPIVILVVRLTLTRNTPDPLPGHWNGRGLSGTVSANAAFGWTLIVAVMTSAMTCWLLSRRPQPYMSHVLAPWLAYVGWLFATAYAEVVLLSRGHATAGGVSLQWWGPVLIYALPGAMALLIWVAEPPWRRPETASKSPQQVDAIDLEPGERVTWIGRASNRWLLMIAIVLALSGVALLPIAWLIAIPLLVTGLLGLIAFHAVVTRIDSRGVHVSLGALGWPTLHVAIDDVEYATADQIDPLHWGGWGYQVSRRGPAVIVRRGPGLVLERRTKPTFAVTVDDATEAAAVVNGLIAVSRRRGTA